MRGGRPRGGAPSRVVLALLVTLTPAPFAPALPRGAEESIAIAASEAGFRPALLTLRKGETVRLALSTRDREHCFALEAFRIEKRIVPGRTTSFDFTPDRVGSFGFYCCLEPDNASQRGRVVVTE
jgi:plastocyanin